MDNFANMLENTKRVEDTGQQDVFNEALPLIDRLAAEHRVETALSVIEALESKGIASPDMYVKKADLFLRSVRQQGAYEALCSALTLDPAHSDALLKRADLLYLYGYLSLAKADYEAVFRLNNTSIAAIAGLCLVHKVEKNFPQALHFARKRLATTVLDDRVAVG